MTDGVADGVADGVGALDVLDVTLNVGVADGVRVDDLDDP